MMGTITIVGDCGRPATTRDRRYLRSSSPSTQYNATDYHCTMTGSSIETFIASLAAAPSTETAFNPWEASTDVDGIRRNNLSLYLHELLSRQTKILLLGEAPGYQGCRLTGIPFTSEHILVNGW